MSTTAQRPQATSGGLKQLFFLLLFGAVLGSVFVCREYLSGSGPAGTEPLSHKEALASHGFYLREVSKECGIDFTHRAPAKLDPRLSHIMPIIVSMGAAVSVVDYDRDGLPDLYVINSGEGSKNCLYHNLGNGKFEEVAGKLGVADLNRPGTGVCMGAIWGDIDNDGYEDLLVYRWGRPYLFHNESDGKGGRRFVDVTDKAGLPRRINANSAVWLDYDRDGRLDLFLAGYWGDDVNLWTLDTTKIMPDSFQFATNGGRSHLLRNRGVDKSGKWLGFEDVTEKVGLGGRRWTLAAAATDLRGTGYPDLVLANDYGVNEFFANHAGKEFVEIGKKTRIGDKSKSGMSVSFGDIYNQGRFAIYTSNITQPGVLLQFNNLWVPEPGTTGDELRYENLATDLGVDRGGWSWGAQFGDLNNDGLVDLVLTNGYISTDSSESYWYEYSRIAGAFEDIIIDAKNWPAMRGRSLGGRQRHCLWLNRDGKFDDVAAAVGFGDTHDGRAVALVDLWKRGVLDVVEANQKGPLLVYKNTVARDRDWIQFELEGTRSNRSAIGAQVKLHWDGKVQIQEVSGGSGYAGQNQRRLHFGLGKNAHIEQVVIQWPSGRPPQVIPASEFSRRGIRLRQNNKVVEPQ